MSDSQRAIAPFGVRMPPDIKAWVQVQAKKERMSMNSFVLRLIEKAKDATKENAPAARTVEASSAIPQTN